MSYSCKVVYIGKKRKRVKRSIIRFAFVIVFVNIVSKKREIYVKFFLYCTYDGSN